jgi:hypothetical protein
MTSSFLMKLETATPKHMASLPAICYPLCWSTGVAMMRSESKEVRHRDYHPEVVLITNPQGKQLH